jgi:hypothetical protein
MARLDLSEPGNMRLAIRLAMHNKRESRRLLVALGACRSGRRQFAGKTLAEVWPTLSSGDLYWYIVRVRSHLYPGNFNAQVNVLHRLRLIANQASPRQRGKITARLYRAWFNMYGELVREWDLP